MPRANQGETKEETGATAGLPALQSKFGPQQKDPRLSKLRDLDIKIQESQKAAQEWYDGFQVACKDKHTCIDKSDL